MRIRLLFATATTAALLAGAALAQPNGASGSNFSQNAPATPDTAVNPPAASLPPASAEGAASTNVQAPPAGLSSSTTSSNGLSSSGLSSSGSDAAQVAPAAGAPTERAPAAIAGTDLITNGPVPDTPENRSKYGQPLSHAGKMTRPAGN
jgi:hypothetical protein